VNPPSGEQIEIGRGDQNAVVVGVGGGLRTFSVGDHEVLDGYGPDEMCTSGRGQVLIPWPNRLEDGTYTFDGRRHQVPLNDRSTKTRSTASSATLGGQSPSTSRTGSS
jgi:aldose 1-epimerase